MENNDVLVSNPSKFELTIEEIRKIPDYENISEEDALETIDSIKNFCLLFYEAVVLKKFF